MTSVIFNPLEEFVGKLRDLHGEKTDRFFEKLVQQSKVNIEENRKTAAEYRRSKDAVATLTRKLKWRKFWRVLMCISVVLIPVVILKATPKIKALQEEIQQGGAKAQELLEKARAQMAPLNSLFTDRDALNLVTETVPLLSFAPCFSAEQEADMRTNYDFCGADSDEESSTDVLAGTYNENPFLFENKLIHTMGTETYHGYKTISWTETYRDSNGRLQRRTRTQTLHATVVKPKPFYDTQVVLTYGAQGAPDLSFSRDATHHHQKSEAAVKRLVRRGGRKLKRKTDRALKNNEDFVSMSNTEFEVLFDALDRTDEVQFRTLFTPLAQTNMVELLLSKDGYGDDFNFFKKKRMNHIVSGHSQGREINLLPQSYVSYDFDEIKENFTVKNRDFFKAVYFDFAPLLAIPAYQERPVHSLKPIPTCPHLYAERECEALANTMGAKYVAHPNSKTPSILKAQIVGSRGRVDETRITAHSYDIFQRVDVVTMLGGDGRYHNVSVPWDEYVPLVDSAVFFVADAASAAGNVLASRNNLCIFR